MGVFDYNWIVGTFYKSYLNKWLHRYPIIAKSVFNCLATSTPGLFIQSAVVNSMKVLYYLLRTTFIIISLCPK